MKLIALPSLDIVKWKNTNKRFAGTKTMTNKVIQMQMKKRKALLQNLKQKSDIASAFTLTKSQVILQGRRPLIKKLIPKKKRTKKKLVKKRPKISNKDDVNSSSTSHK